MSGLVGLLRGFLNEVYFVNAVNHRTPRTPTWFYAASLSPEWADHYGIDAIVLVDSNDRKRQVFVPVQIKMSTVYISKFRQVDPRRQEIIVFVCRPETTPRGIRQEFFAQIQNDVRCAGRTFDDFWRQLGAEPHFE